ncbi:hypothetical protein EJ110_NYTH05805 [Nymphaea thermarum]|nr:hypothetical protein EJ110_NYTH05805 [Nymphaea thermarum]
MADSSSSSTVHTNLPDVGSTRTDHVPVQVTTIQLNKENYSWWSAAITMGIAGRGRIAYVNGRKVEPVEGSMAWDTWFLEDNQVKMWIVNSVSSYIQPLILRKKTARDMWVILEHMYGQKKRKVRVYQLMRDLYSLRQGTRSVAEFYAALKSKWEDLDYHSDLTWKCPQDQLQYMTKEWENRVFLFLSGLNDDFSIEDVYARVEAEEQRKLVSSDRKGEEQSAFVSRASVGSSRFSCKCTHCKKLGHTVDFCWDLHLEKKNGRGRPSGSKQPVSSATGPGDRKASFSAEQLRELRAYLSQVDEGQTEKSDDVLDKDEEDISTEAHELGKKEEEVEEEVSHMVTEQEGTRMFGQEPAFQRLIFITMLAWEHPYEKENDISGVPKHNSLQVNLGKRSGSRCRASRRLAAIEESVMASSYNLRGAKGKEPARPEVASPGRQGETSPDRGQENLKDMVNRLVADVATHEEALGFAAETFEGFKEEMKLMREQMAESVATNRSLSDLMKTLQDKVAELWASNQRLLRMSSSSSSHERTSRVDVQRLAKYSGSRDARTIDNFLFQVDYYLDLQNVVEEDLKIKTAVMLLVGGCCGLVETEDV